MKKWRGWTEWHPLIGHPKIENRCGCYIIAAPRELQRIHGIDEHGILDVGETKRLRDRVAHFIGCARGSVALGHAAGVRYHALGFEKVFPLESLYLCWKYVESKELAYQLEGKILQEYVAKHYELPPLNYKFNYS